MKTRNKLLVITALLIILIYYWSFDRVSKRLIEGWDFSSAMTIQEVEKSELESIRKFGDGDNSLPAFGHQNAQWLELKSLYKPGDKVYSISYSADMENGETSIVGGYVLARGDIIIFEIVTYVS